MRETEKARPLVREAAPRKRSSAEIKGSRRTQCDRFPAIVSLVEFRGGHEMVSEGQSAVTASRRASDLEQARLRRYGLAEMQCNGV